MELTTNEGIIIGYGPWSRPEDTDPVKWGNGELVDTLSIVFDGEAAPRRLTLDVSLNDADLRPALHSIVRLACTLTPDVRDGLYRADRRNPGQFVPASIPRDKWRVYAIDVVRAAPAVADDRLVGAGA